VVAAIQTFCRCPPKGTTCRRAYSCGAVADFHRLPEHPSALSIMFTTNYHGFSSWQLAARTAENKCGLVSYMAKGVAMSKKMAVGLR
jgi:hypothetical protein